ncbi:MAG TPA: hypothetical protein VGB37_11490 [Candidatus Lokiarchaeia archaeon]
MRNNNNFEERNSWAFDDTNVKEKIKNNKYYRNIRANLMKKKLNNNSYK